MKEKRVVSNTSQRIRPWQLTHNERQYTKLSTSLTLALVEYTTYHLISHLTGSSGHAHIQNNTTDYNPLTDIDPIQPPSLSSTQYQRRRDSYYIVHHT